MQSYDQTFHEKSKQLMNIKDKSREVEKTLWKKVYKYVPILRHIPWILFIGVGNSLSMNACHKDSDIDLFIITRKNRIWTTRVLVTLFFSILWLRKTSKHHAGRFCLSFFVTEDALDFKDIAIENDIYLYFWILYMKPVIDKSDTYNRFLQDQSWCDMGEYRSMLEENKKHILRHSCEGRNQSDSKSTLSFLSIPAFAGMTAIWNIIEKILKFLLLPKTKKSFQKLEKPFWVMISDTMLKFHDRDKRKQIRERLVVFL